MNLRAFLVYPIHADSCWHYIRINPFSGNQDQCYEIWMDGQITTHLCGIIFRIRSFFRWIFWKCIYINIYFANRTFQKFNDLNIFERLICLKDTNLRVPHFIQTKIPGLFKVRFQTFLSNVGNQPVKILYCHNWSFSYTKFNTFSKISAICPNSKAR